MENRQVVERKYNGVTIIQWPDGSMNATAMCKANGKDWGDYWENKSTQEVIKELEAETGIPASELVKSKKGGRPAEQGTRVHKLVAYHLAQWCSPSFAVRVMRWLDELFETGRVELRPNAELSGLRAELDRLRVEVARLAGSGPREVGMPLGVRERIRQLWPTAKEKTRQLIVARVKQQAFRRQVLLWQPLENGPLCIDQVHVRLVDEQVDRARLEFEANGRKAGQPHLFDAAGGGA